jgi:two-component system OmpR family sensor kinase
MPIRLRLALLCTTLVLAVTAGGGVLLTHVLGSDLLRELDGELRSRADAAASALRAGAPATAEASQVEGPQDLFVQVAGEDGRIVASSGSTVAAPLLSAAQLRAAAASLDPIERTLPPGMRGVQADRLRLVVSRSGAPGGGYVVVGGTLDPVDDAVRDMTRELLVAAAVVAPLSALGAWGLAGAALGPVERLRRDVARISDRDEGARVRSPRTRDELAALAATMNGLLGRLQAALGRERRLVADAAHELRTPLAILRTELELAGRPERTREELVQAVANAAQETDRLARLAEDLLFLARTDEGVPVLRLEPVPLREVLHEAVAAHAAQAAAASVSVGVAVHDDMVVVLDEARIRQAVENLVDNAVRAAPAGSAIDVGVQVEDGVAVISVSDSGPGFHPDFIAHAFERFRRDDAARARDGGGSGLGLAIVDAIARAHRGRAEARNRPGGGATVDLAIPLAGPGEHPG